MRDYRTVFSPRAGSLKETQSVFFPSPRYLTVRPSQKIYFMAPKTHKGGKLSEIIFGSHKIYFLARPYGTRRLGYRIRYLTDKPKTHKGGKLSEIIFGSHKIYFMARPYGTRRLGYRIRYLDSKMSFTPGYNCA